MSVDIENAARASAAASTLFLGRNGDFWDFWLIWSCIAVVVAATAVGVTTAGSLIAHKREASGSKVELDRYKHETANLIAAASTKAEEARAETAKANEAAAKAEQKTAELRLALDTAVAERAPRRLSAQQRAELITLLMPKNIPKGKVIINPLWTDGEAVRYASDLKNALLDAGYDAVDPDMSERIMSLNQLGMFLYVKDAEHRPAHLNAIGIALKRVGINVSAVEQTDVSDANAVYLVVGAHP